MADEFDASGKPGAHVNKDAPIPEDPNAQTSRPGKRHTFGMPAGSVRALLTLIIVAVVIVESMRGVELSAFWTETLLIALAHYFTTRRLVDLPKTVLLRLQDEGHIERDAHPLHLPRHSIRLLIVLAFAGLGAYLQHYDRLIRDGRLAFEDPAVSVLITVGAYSVGMLTRPILDWWKSIVGDRRLYWWDDLKAIVVIAVLVVALSGRFVFPDRLVPGGFQNLALGLVLFYFGSR
jgi:hypothetical protein